MNINKKLLLAGVAGAAVASTVLVTVYEGHVVAETRAARTELPAGSHATLGGAGDAMVAAGGALATPTDDAHASREQLVERSRVQQAQLAALRARVAQLETTPGARGKPGMPGIDEASDSGRPWHDPSPEQLTAWAAECHVRADVPDVDRFTPLRDADPRLGVEAGEVDGYNAALGDVVKQWKGLVRGLYLEATGDAAGADAMATSAMFHEIEDKSPPGEQNAILQRIAQERAGLAPPPAELTKSSPLERMLRAYVQLGDQTEAALAKRVGADRAHAIRGDGWGGRTEMAGCPRPAANPK